MISGTRNCITFICKKLHTFVKVSIKIVPISFWAGPITENINQVYTIYLKGRNFRGNLISRMAEKIFFAEFNFADEKFG